jgi:Uma2 family endonuclease
LVPEVVSEDEPYWDLVDKRRHYAEARVPEYLIANPQTKTITVLRLRGDTYEEAGVYRRGESTKSVLLPDVSIAVAETFDAARIGSDLRPSVRIDCRRPASAGLAPAERRLTG